MVPESADGWSGDYSYVKIDTAPDAVHGPGAAVSARLVAALSGDGVSRS